MRGQHRVLVQQRVPAHPGRRRGHPGCRRDAAIRTRQPAGDQEVRDRAEAVHVVRGADVPGVRLGAGRLGRVRDRGDVRHVVVAGRGEVDQPHRTVRQHDHVRGLDVHVQHRAVAGLGRAVQGLERAGDRAEHGAAVELRRAARRGAAGQPLDQRAARQVVHDLVRNLLVAGVRGARRGRRRTVEAVHPQADALDTAAVQVHQHRVALVPRAELVEQRPPRVRAEHLHRHRGRADPAREPYRAVDLGLAARTEVMEQPVPLASLGQRAVGTADEIDSGLRMHAGLLFHTSPDHRDELIRW